jgi:hypothetical protein
MLKICKHFIINKKKERKDMTKAGQYVKMGSSHPMCDVCCDHWASYDAKTVNGPWAFLCEQCFAKLGIGLGTGKGQRLVWDEGDVNAAGDE